MNHLRFARRAAPAIFAAAFWLTTDSAVADTDFGYTLDERASTSAGVYATTGSLVRTLWRGTDEEAGVHAATWDDRDDDGNTVPDGVYEIRLLHHDVHYVWDGAVGNSSDNQLGEVLHRGFRPISAMACVGDSCFFAMGYNEQQNAMKRFAIASPQAPKNILQGDSFTSYPYVTTDGNRTYWANNGGFSAQTFVIATAVSDDSAVMFNAGESVCLNARQGGACYEDQLWPSVIDRTVETDKGHISGIAVQPNGRLLFVTRDTVNAVHILDKTTGASVRDVGVDTPRYVVADGSNNLWMVVRDNAKDVVRRYQTDGDGNLTAATTLAGIDAPSSLALSAKGDTLIVADAGTSQQIKAFDTATGALRWTRGRAGGYGNDPTVTNEAFNFLEGGFVAFSPDGSYWVGESSNRRVQHFDADGTFHDRIAFIPASYSAGVMAADPTRVFSDFLELRVDYSKPIGGTNGSWELVKNWHVGLPEKFVGFGAGIGNARELSNGRVYTVLTDGNTQQRVIVELPSTGPVRETGVVLDEPGLVSFTATGEIHYATEVDGVQRVWVRALSGFDGDGNPQWAAAQLFGSAPVRAGDPAVSITLGFGAFQIPITPSGVAVTFSADRDPGFHLGGIARNGVDWLWRASPAGPLDGHGAYDIGNGVQYAGNVAHSIGRSIIYGYHGEFWMDSEASQWMHFYDDGLFVGQFGTLGTQRTGPQSAVEGFAGNAFSPGIAVVDCRTYLWHNDESNHAGVVRWSVRDLESIREARGSGSKGTMIVIAETIPPEPECVVAETPSAPSGPGFVPGATDPGKIATRVSGCTALNTAPSAFLALIGLVALRRRYGARIRRAL